MGRESSVEKAAGWTNPCPGGPLQNPVSEGRHREIKLQGRGEAAGWGLRARCWAQPPPPPGGCPRPEEALSPAHENGRTGRDGRGPPGRRGSSCRGGGGRGGGWRTAPRRPPSRRSRPPPRAIQHHHHHHRNGTDTNTPDYSELLVLSQEFGPTGLSRAMPSLACPGH